MKPQLAEALIPFLEFAVTLAHARAPDFMPVTNGSPMAAVQLRVEHFKKLVDAVQNEPEVILSQDELAADQGKLDL